MTRHRIDLVSGFDPPDLSAWNEAVVKVLRGRDFDSVLVSETRDGLDIQPLYTAESTAESTGAVIDSDPPRVSHGWDVRQAHGGVDAAECNRGILEDLRGGVTSIELSWPMDASDSYLRAALDGVDLAIAPVALAPHSSVEQARELASLVGQSGPQHWLGLDPLGGVTRGDDIESVPSQMTAAAEFAGEAVGLGHRVFTVDTTRHADAGATEAQQLAVAMSTTVAYLRLCENAGLEPSAAASLIGFRLTATADQFLTMSLLRASRVLWARVLESCGVAESGRVQAQHAVTSEAMFSRRDPWVNMLRGTTAALAAGVGGADAVTVLPFDIALGQPDSLGRRAARNTQLLLIDESHVSRMTDPAAGSWFMESLTSRLADMAWAGFQSIESEGGMEAVLRDGSLEAEIRAAWIARLGDLETRREPLTGVSEFPLLDEPILSRQSGPGSTSGWPVRRLAQPFEDLRDESDRRLAADGHRPRVHLATLGELVDHTARTTWTTNLLAVGGIDAMGGDGDGAVSAEEAAARFAASGCQAAVICSSDAIYAVEAVAAAEALSAAGASLVAIACCKSDLQNALKAAGVEHFWTPGLNIPQALTPLHPVL